MLFLKLLLAFWIVQFILITLIYMKTSGYKVFRGIFIIGAGVVLFSLSAKAESSLKDVEKRIDGFESRMEDLEINLSWQIAAQQVCPANSAIDVYDELKKPCEEVDYGHSFDDCMAKQGRFHMTKAEVESRLYSMWLCGHNQGIRWHNDP